ncbi:helix-turn-helix transcriptional regulator [Helicobacter pametensis]|uniref:helix-turn-helix transcriptional regulator n=1 Tax=Helicobacter pametensis TaxID=95149 RepID=UPI0004B5AA7F|nr:WYL domain-containing protein [Helicobacter pametensis]
MSKDHDRLALRLVHTISKLNSGELLSVSELASEFGVDIRTIQRDIQRLSFLPIEKKNGKISLASYALGSVGFEDLREFLKLCGIEELFPNLESRTLQDLFNPNLNTSLLIHPANFEKIQAQEFERLQVAILNRRKIFFHYHQKSRDIKPYKLVHYLGRWYLLGVDGEDIKTFALEKIKNLALQDEGFELDQGLLEEIEANRYAFLSASKNEITLFIDKYAMPYFEKRRILPNQKILNKDESGMEIITQSSYDEEILRIIQQWIPHIFILSPESLKERLRERMEGYLGMMN